jgi:hypothetical protein
LNTIGRKSQEQIDFLEIRGMNEKLRKAIANNNDLYRVIFEQYQIKSQNNDFSWYCLEETLPLYSNLVTTSKDWKPDEIFHQIDSNFKLEGWSEWSIKDSFGEGDLTEFGFSKLFEASWFYLEPKSFVPLSEKTELHYEIVKSEQILGEWKLCWDADRELGNKIFTPQLLLNKDVFFIAGFSDKQICSGCFINETEGVLGVSNFFAPDKSIIYWAEIIQFIYKLVGHQDIVGYERQSTVENLKIIGFEEEGNLKVWLKK